MEIFNPFTKALIRFEEPDRMVSVKYIKKNEVCKKILSLPINTNIENI